MQMITAHQDNVTIKLICGQYHNNDFCSISAIWKHGLTYPDKYARLQLAHHWSQASSTAVMEQSHRRSFSVSGRLSFRASEDARSSNTDVE